jgi:hypothetical protein
MKAVVIATDYVKDTNGEFKVLEMNTQTDILFKDANDYLDLDSLEQLVLDSGITNIEVIIPKHASRQVFDIERPVDQISGIYFENAIYDRFNANGVSVNTHYTTSDSITIPFIEDNDTTLVIRVSYDSTALIDSVYCADNFEFLKLMYDVNPTSIPSTYVNHTDLGFDTIGDVVKDNGGYPNYIIKERFPTTNYEQYPKVLKINNLDELNSIKSNLLSNTLLQEYVFNPTDTIEGKLKTYRVISMVYGSELDILDLTHPFEHTNPCAFGETADFDTNNELAMWERVCYLQKYKNRNQNQFRYDFDSESKIFMPDGSITNVDTLISGSIVKTLNFVDMPTDEGALTSSMWSQSFDSLSNSLEVTTTNVVNTESQYRMVWLKNIELSNGSIFSDVDVSKCVSKIAEQTEYRFNRIQYVQPNDSILLFNTQTNTIEEAIVLNIEYSYELMNVYSLNVEPIDALLTAEEGTETPIYSIFQHNLPSCDQYCCDGTYWPNQYPQCPSSGNSGYCSYTYTYDYCIDGSAYGTPPGCYQCFSACLGQCGGAQK